MHNINKNKYKIEIRTYFTFKQTFTIKPYIQQISRMTQLRLGILPLEMETVYRFIPIYDKSFLVILLALCMFSNSQVRRRPSRLQDLKKIQKNCWVPHFANFPNWVLCFWQKIGKDCFKQSKCDFFSNIQVYD